MDSKKQRASRSQLCVNNFIITRIKSAKSSGNSSAYGPYPVPEAHPYFVLSFSMPILVPRTFTFLLLYACFRLDKVLSLVEIR